MKHGILLTAFGAKGQQAENALRLFEDTARARFQGWPVRWAFTSGQLRQSLAEQRKKTDSVHKALQKMRFERFTHVAVQALHLIPGLEYNDILHEAEQANADPAHEMAVRVGAPLLHNVQSVPLVAHALLAHCPPLRQKNESVIYMGHGSPHSSTELYAQLAGTLHSLDPNVYVGTMKGGASLDEILESLACQGVRKVWLLPLLAIVGRHALEDMAGAGVRSWKTRIEARGIVCEPIMHGIVEYARLVDIWMNNLEDACLRLQQG